MLTNSFKTLKIVAARHHSSILFVFLLSPSLVFSADTTTQFIYLQDKISETLHGPKMLLIKKGEFLMGSPQNEEGRYENEGPQHKVTFKYDFYLAQTPITVGQFRSFIEATGYKTVAEEKGWSNLRNPVTGDWEKNTGMNWRHNNRGELSSDNLPVVHVAWNDAVEYTNWLSRVTGKPYRLPSESEFEYANRAGTQTKYWWGNDTPKTKTANIKGEFDIPANDKTWFPTPEERQYAYSQGYTPFLFKGYGDGFWGISPVAAFEPNPFGLYDTTGNVWEWMADCWNTSYHGAPADGSARTNDGVCELRVLRGGSYYCFPRHVRSANRWTRPATDTAMYIGFRIARDKTSDEDNGTASDNDF